MLIYASSDPHGNFSHISNARWPDQKELTKEDLFFFAGDFGLIFNSRPVNRYIPGNLNDPCWTNEELYWYQFLNNRPFTTVFIDGNHDCFDRLSSYKVKEKWGGKVHMISDSIIHLMRGQIYDIDGLKVFAMGGARSIDRGLILGEKQAAKDAHRHWWAEEMPSPEERKEALINLEQHNFKVDVVITHDAPSLIYNALGLECLSEDIDGLPRFFQSLIEGTEDHPALKYKLWLCGHLHRDLQHEKIRVLYRDILDVQKELIRVT